MKSKTGIIAILILMVVMTEGCVTRKKCMRRYPLVTESSHVEKTRDSLVYRDTTIYVPVQGEIVRDSINVPCPPALPSTTLRMTPDTAFAETDLARAKAWYSKQKVHLELEQKDTTLQLQLDNAIKESFHWKSEYDKAKIVQPLKYIPGVYRVAFWLWIFVFIVIGLFLVLKYKVGLFK